MTTDEMKAEQQGEAAATHSINEGAPLEGIIPAAMKHVSDWMPNKTLARAFLRGVARVVRQAHLN